LSRQIINIGSQPNDGTGDPIRSAMIKVNDNFSEVYGSWTATGPFIIASDNSNTVITDKSITVGLVSVGANLFVNSTALFINGNSYISSVGALVPTLNIGFGLKGNSTTFVVGNTISNTTISSTGGITGPSYSVVGGPVIDQTGITVGQSVLTNSALTTPSLVTGNTTVNSVGFTNKNTTINGDQVIASNITSTYLLTANSIDAGDIVANTVKFKGGGGIQSGNIVANAVTVGNVYMVPNFITVGNGFSNGTVVGFGGVNTGTLRASGNVYANGIVANTLYVTTQSIDQISANLITLGALATINSTYLVMPNILSSNTRCYDTLQADQQIRVGDLSTNAIITPSTLTIANVSSNTLSVNKISYMADIYSNSQIIVTDTNNNKTIISGSSVTTGDMTITKTFTAADIGANTNIYLGGRLLANTTLFTFNQFQISDKDGGTFFGPSGTLYVNNSTVEAGGVTLASLSVRVGGSKVNATSVVAPTLVTGNVYSNSFIRLGLNDTDPTLTNTNIMYGISNIALDSISVGVNVTNASGVYVTGTLGVNGALIANNSKGNLNQVLTSNGNGVYWAAAPVDPGAMQKAQNLNDVANKATARTNLSVPDLIGTGASGTWNININGKANTAGLADTSTFANTAGNSNQLQGQVVGASPNQIIALDNLGRLPAVDGSQLTNINGSAIVGDLPTSSDKIIISSTEPDPAQGGQNWIWFKV